MGSQASKGARAGGVPPFRAQLATLVDEPPEGDDYLHETKFDGYRMACRVERGKAQLESRSGQDWTESFPDVVRGIRALGLKRALLDGEVAVLLPDGSTSFQALQNALKGAPGGGGKRVYFLFDLLHLEGTDLRQAPLLQRKEALAELLRKAPSVLRYSAHHIGEGPRVLAEACKLGMEGIVSKRVDQPYRPGRGMAWLKSKCLLRQEFVVGGFTEPEGTRQGFGALLIGYYADDGLKFAGKVGNGPGFTAEYTSRLRAELNALEVAQCPFKPRPRGAGLRQVHWVKPLRVAEVSFSEWTAGGAARQPLLLGFREDKRPEQVRREVAHKRPRAAARKMR